MSGWIKEKERKPDLNFSAFSSTPVHQEQPVCHSEQPHAGALNERYPGGLGSRNNRNIMWAEIGRKGSIHRRRKETTPVFFPPAPAH